MVPQRYEHLFQNYLDDTISPEDYVLLRNWLINPDNAESFSDLIGAAIKAPGQQVPGFAEIEMDSVYNELLQREELDQLRSANQLPQGSRVRFLSSKLLRYAAILLLIAATATFLYLNSKSHKEIAQLPSTGQPADILPGGNKAILTLSDGSTIVLDSAATGDLARQGNARIIKLGNGSLAYHSGIGADEQLFYNTIRTPKGGLYQVALPDGTMIWLNAASSVTFPTVFGAERKITITGEAYLEVATDKKKPFTITANGTEVAVLGTSFNVNAYEDEAGVKTSLISGSVKVSKDNKAAVLKPGEQCFAVNGRPFVIAPDDIEQTLSWKNGAFYFKHTKLADAMRQISRWYDVEVVYENGAPDILLGGEMKRDLTLSQMLESLGKLGVVFRIEKKRLIVHNELPAK